MSERRQGFKRHGSRYKARRRAVDILFEAESRDVDPVAIIDDRRKLSAAIEPVVAPVAEYTESIINGVAIELDTIDVFLSEHIAETWTLGRLPSVDRAILRVACWEMIYNHDVPVTTTVVEAVEIASEYSTDNSSAYINATLDAMASKVEDLRERATNPKALRATEADSGESVAPWDDSDSDDVFMDDFESIDNDVETDAEVEAELEKSDSTMSENDVIAEASTDRIETQEVSEGPTDAASEDSRS